MSTVRHLGGKMYGDGEYVVTFRQSGTAPLQAHVIGSGAKYGVVCDLPGQPSAKPSVELARRVIESVQA